jgi:endonuclease/exonuclease/phosphatase family metal-dependent hydrolase
MRTSQMMWRTAAALALVAGCHSHTTGPTNSIRVLVYNIHAGKDVARAENLARVAAIVTDSRADVVLLQEVDNRTKRSGGVDQLGKLRELTGYYGVFGKTIDYDGGEYGIAILSRRPLVSSSFTRLPVTISDEKERARYEERGALTVKVATPGGDVRIVNTHLDAFGPDSNRIQQAVTLLSIANAQRDSGYTLLGGDLNSIPSSAVAAMLQKAGWTDLFTKCGSGEMNSFPADVPNRRIDYLFASSDAVCRKASVLNTQASDHRPVLFEVITRH